MTSAICAIHHIRVYLYFDATFTEDDLAGCAEKVIRLFAPKLVLGISDEMSSQGDIERIRLVGRIVETTTPRSIDD